MALSIDQVSLLDRVPPPYVLPVPQKPAAFTDAGRPRLILAGQASRWVRSAFCAPSKTMKLHRRIL